MVSICRVNKFIQVLVLFIAFQWCNVSAYTLYECGGNRLTASGAEATEGTTVASDHLPFGTVVEILGQRYEVQDRFGGGYGDRIDIFMEDYNQAIQFGRQWLLIKIIN